MKKIVFWVIALMFLLSTCVFAQDPLTCNHKLTKVQISETIGQVRTPGFVYVCEKCGAMFPSADEKTWKMGDEVIFMYWGHDSQKDVECPGVIVGLRGGKFIILPVLQISPFYNYVTVEADKIVRRAEFNP